MSYNKIVTYNTDFKPLSEYENILSKLGYVSFTDLSDENESLIRQAKTCQEYLTIYLYLNKTHGSARYSNRFQRFLVKNVNRNANRSMVDIYMSALHYCPQFANLELLYKEMVKLLFHNPGIGTQICPNINRRVWNYHGDTRDINAVYKRTLDKPFRNGKDLANFYLNRKDELGVTFSDDRGNVVMNVDVENKAIPVPMG